MRQVLGSKKADAKFASAFVIVEYFVCAAIGLDPYAPPSSLLPKRFFVGGKAKGEILLPFAALTLFLEHFQIFAEHLFEIQRNGCCGFHFQNGGAGYFRLHYYAVA